MHPTIRHRAGIALAAVTLAAAGAALTPIGALAAPAAPAAPTAAPAAPTTVPAAAAAVPAVAHLRAVSGDSQTVARGKPTGQPLTAKALDASFQPVEGATVTFTSPAELTFPGGATTATVTTGADGTAQAPALTAGNSSGTFLVMATADRRTQAAFEVTVS
ncbi:hypothetical protein ACIQ9E_03455 [Streptomyces sp. NPDC094448]|uniref:hypothetical protein n=1 Tax=Streptomyces sp. NPDC094448 TaxID=3366063 RepID=UPI0037FFC84B